MGNQIVGQDGQPILDKDRKCPHGVFRDNRGNSACENCFDHKTTGSYLLGIAAGYEQLAGWLAKRAGDAFSAGRDADATMLRTLSREVSDDAKKRRAEQEQHDSDT